MTFLTADEHYNHSNVIHFCNRPFSSVEEMNDTIISNHNEVVGEGDVVIHLGDFCFNKAKTNEILRKLNGTHLLVRGNHDPKNISPDNSGFYDISDTLYTRNISSEFTFFLSHYAHRVWRNSHYGSIHCYGHSHGSLPGLGRSMDVGVDTNNFYPYSVDQIIAKLRHIQV